jgi:hypothetical protein
MGFISEAFSEKEANNVNEAKYIFGRITKAKYDSNKKKIKKVFKTLTSL